MNLSITIDPVQNSQNYEVHYNVKGFERTIIHSPIKTDLSLHFDNIKYIAEYNSPQIDKSTNKLKLNLKNMPNKIDFIQVIAQNMDKEIVEYLSYVLFEIKIKDGKDGSTKNINFILLISIILGFLFVIILILVVTLVIYFNRNKGLLDQVKKVSFRNSKASERDIVNKDVLISISENDK